MHYLVIDLTHGGVKIAVSLAKKGKIVHAYDIYGTLKPLDRDMMEVYGIDIMDLDSLKSLKGDICVISPIHSTLSEDEIERYNREGNFAKIRDKAMDILSKKAVTKKMLLETLIKKEYDKNLSKEVVDELIKIGCIDDLEFAKNYARDAFEYKKHGKMRITTDLLKKGVDKSDIDEAFLSLSFSYDDNILEIINTKFKNADFRDIKTKNKIIRYLAYRGYNISDIMSCLGKME